MENLLPLNLQAIYDTIEIPVGIDLHSLKFTFFDNLAGKGYDLTNMPQPLRLPAGWHMTIQEIFMALVRQRNNNITIMWGFPHDSILSVELWNDGIKRWGYADKLASWHYRGIIEGAAEIQEEPLHIIGSKERHPYHLMVGSGDTIKAHLTYIESDSIDIPLKCRLWLKGKIGSP